MDFSVTILGTSSAIPNSKRNPPSQLVNHNGQLFLIDCGEGTQTQLRRNHISLSKINRILISHLHADHVLGLFGLISSYALLGRTNTLHIYSDPRLKDLVEFQNVFFNNKLSYQIEFHFLEEKKDAIVFEDEKLIVKAFPLKHSVPTHGFLIKEKKRLRKIDKAKISFYQIPISKIKDIKQGSDFKTQSGKIISNKELTFDVPKERSYAYCSDTAYYKEIVRHIEGVDLLFHESTFCKEDLKRAYQTQHSTSQHAAEIAKEANANKLLLGHFSTRYKNLDSMLSDAKKIFLNTEIAKEKKCYSIEESI